MRGANCGIRRSRHSGQERIRRPVARTADESGVQVGRTWIHAHGLSDSRAGVQREVHAGMVALSPQNVSAIVIVIAIVRRIHQLTQILRNVLS